MARSIKDFNEEMSTKGYTLHAYFSFYVWNGSTQFRVTHFWKYKEGVSKCIPAAAVRYFNAPKKVEKWLDDMNKWHHDQVTPEDIENFFETWNKKMRACGLDPETIVQIGGDEDLW